MRRSASLRRRRTGWSRSWLSKHESSDLIAVPLPTHVVRVVVPRALDHHELHRAGSGGGYVTTHSDGHQHVGGPVEDECGAVDAAHSSSTGPPTCWCPSR